VNQQLESDLNLANQRLRMNKQNIQVNVLSLVVIIIIYLYIMNSLLVKIRHI